MLLEGYEFNVMDAIAGWKKAEEDEEERRKERAKAVALDIIGDIKTASSKGEKSLRVNNPMIWADAMRSVIACLQRRGFKVIQPRDSIHYIVLFNKEYSTPEECLGKVHPIDWEGGLF